MEKINALKSFHLKKAFLRTFYNMHFSLYYKLEFGTIEIIAALHRRQFVKVRSFSF